MERRKTLNMDDWDASIAEGDQRDAVRALEEGRVLYFPKLAFALSDAEKALLSPDIMLPKAKNISFDGRKDIVGGSCCTGEKAELLKAFIKRYSVASRCFLEKLIPHYTRTLIQARTSFRPVEIFGRKSSYRKDDTLLHVDSFPSAPTHGQRILRFFTNINLEGKPRVWRLGEPFEDVVQKMAPRVSPPLPGLASLLKFVGITKSYRTPYDHYMLQMHNKMKGDAHYQMTVPQEEVDFPSGSSWIVFTDKTSHAAMSGQHVLEQTFHLPVHGLMDPSLSPLQQLEQYLGKNLVPAHI